MKAFENTEVSKQELLASLARHRAADNLLKGTYWRPAFGDDDSRGGCAVGCTLHDFRPGHESAHGLYPELFGIPASLAKLEDRIFEGLPIEQAREWPERFISAINPGADLRQVEDRFVLWMLSDTKSPLSKWADEPWMRGVADLYRRRLAGEEPEVSAWVAARGAACTAALTVWAAADAAARNAARARAARDAAARNAARALAARDAAARNAVDAAVAVDALAVTAMADALIRIIEEVEK